MYHYSVPPQGYVRYSYNTSATTSPSGSPQPNPPYTYWIPPQYQSPTTSPKSTKRHSRKQSYSYPQPPGGWHSPAGYPSQSYYTTRPDYQSPPVYQDYVSRDNFEGSKPKARRFSKSGPHGGGNTDGPKRHASTRSQKQPIINDTSDEADEPTFMYIRPQTSRHKEEKYSKPKPKANKYFFFNQVPAQEKASDSQKTRPRRPSESRPSTAKPAKAAPPPREATAADAAKHRIPAGYSLKNWDPTESPVLLLGSVFDANSLGKWIYDWTVFHHGPSTPMSEVAGDLWLLLIKLACKMKRADECLPRVRYPDNRETIKDFLAGGDRLWARFKKLLKICEDYMWRVARKEGVKGSVKMGKNSGCEFVDSIFGRDRELEETESLMHGIRLWNMRFDANCEEILRRPSVA
ncbi:MAG: hypothetical protein ALECFALPRED_006508 [Alectoria fallacina]|uniref:Vegetative cell wall protein gp1 n=1 Tax=Alectoria fallacina TaxID=1903189 RepID=A0A8H3G9Q5_9LECA|nr:MAG: hypothetical protein ALECFALPRED_006508 [Alectoria fallacina]